MQSKRHSHIEALSNQVAGLAIGWSLVFFAFPLMGIEPTVGQATISSAMFFVASYARAYTIRRAFNYFQYKEKNECITTQTDRVQEIP